MPSDLRRDFRLTPRERFIVKAALSYAFSNVSELNEALETDDGRIKVGDEVGDEIFDLEIEALQDAL